MIASRRRLLGWGCALALGASRPAWAAPRAERMLAFVNLHTGERLREAFWAEGAPLREGCARIDHVLRDHRTGESRPMDPRLLDLLWRLSDRLESREPFQVISGYRSPHSNALLASQSGGVARNSLHMQGIAIDVRLEGVPLDRLHRAAIDLKGGGVGLYRRSNFVHLDTGRVRAW